MVRDVVKNLPDDTDIDRLPPELWLGKAAHRNVGEVRVFQSELAAISWVKGSSPFTEIRYVWRVTVEVQEMYQSAATVEKLELKQE